MAMKLAIYGYDTDIGKLVIETIEEQDLSLGDVFPLSPLTGEYDAIQIKGQNYFVQQVEEFENSENPYYSYYSQCEEESCAFEDETEIYWEC